VKVYQKDAYLVAQIFDRIDILPKRIDSLESSNLMPRKLFNYLLFIVILGLTACSLEVNPSPTPQGPDESSPVGTKGPTSTSTPTRDIGIITPEATFQPVEINPDDLQGVNLEFWHPWTQEVNRVVDSLIDQFNSENTYGIFVNSSSRGNNLYLDLRSSISNGSIPDIVLASSSQLQSWNSYGNILQDLNMYAGDSIWGLMVSEVEDYFPAIWEQGLVSGNRFGIPGFTSSRMVAYNQTWAHELGFNSPPETPAELKTQACAAAASTSIDESEPVGGWIADYDPATIMSWLLAFGVDGINENRDGYDFYTPEVEAAFDFIKGMFKSGCAWIPEAKYPDNEFATRKGLFYTTSITGFPELSTAFESNEWGDEWVPLPFPSVDRNPTIHLYGLSYAILKSSQEEQLAAWLFVKWMTQPENQARIIEATSSYVNQTSANLFLGDYARKYPQWADAQEFVRFGVVEPHFGSWGIARWVLSDAVAALLRPDFTSEEIPLLLEELNLTLAETHLNNP
jgi:ABC-type glycerol-3-phosphate transport system substrate-binding protein